jgi:molybdenum cofactor synthesis domain-containing protein
MMPKIVLLVVSDRVSSGKMADESGPAAAEALGAAGHIIGTEIVPDKLPAIRDCLVQWCQRGADVILTLGGTGFSPADVTPEATRAVIDREAPGLMTALTLKGLSHTPRAALSRAVAGMRGGTLIINLPGSPKAVGESVEFLRELLPHALEMMEGKGHPKSESRPARRPV